MHGCTVAVPGIAQAPVALGCVLQEHLKNDSRHVFFGRVTWVRLQDYFPVGRFGASFYTRTRDRFAMGEAGPAQGAGKSEVHEMRGDFLPCTQGGKGHLINAEPRWQAVCCALQTSASSDR
jgi:hypothetical protein